VDALSNVKPCHRPYKSAWAWRPIKAVNRKTAPDGTRSESLVFIAQPHADYRASYRKEAAEEAWKEMIAWFKKYKVLS
jgi:carboxymethylenebutenolidase